MRLNPGNSPTMQFGPFNFPYRSDLICIVSRAAAGGQNSNFKRIGASADYQVTAGKTFRAVGMMVMSTGTTAINATIGYADNSVGFSSASAFTNPVYAMGGSTALLWISHSLGEAANNPKDYIVPLIGWSVPAQKYPVLTSQSSEPQTIMMWGYEE